VTAAARLSDDALLEAWEEAVSAGPVERALALAVAASPGSERDAVERWSIGQRDGLLLDAHGASFGDTLAAVTECPECSGTLELMLRPSELRTEHGDADKVYDDLASSGLRLRFRLPTSLDLLEIAGAPDADVARDLLIERCVVGAEPDGAVSPAAANALAERIAACDPQSDVQLALTCPACNHAWSAPFDIADFLWRKVDDRARRLLAEIASLASAFGWSEREILALGEARRAHYLGLVAG
jgi:hypothetical protein